VPGGRQITGPGKAATPAPARHLFTTTGAYGHLPYLTVMSSNIAVIGAGMAGLTAARYLHNSGHRVTLFDKGRKPGGRLATRREATQRFNHGCQFFTARTPEFGKAMAALGAAPWPAAGAACRVGVPDMASLAEALAADLPAVRLSAHVTALARDPSGWRLSLRDTPEMAFDTLILAVPAPQAAALIGAHPFAARLSAVHMAPCWTVMLAFEDEPAGPDVVRPEGGPLSWIAREGSRPQALPKAAYTLQASAAWSAAQLEAPADMVVAALTAAFAEATGITAAPAAAGAHRWRYALADAPLGEAFLWDAELRLGLCGDWCLAGRLEAAFLSGRGLGIRLAS